MHISLVDRWRIKTRNIYCKTKWVILKNIKNLDDFSTSGIEVRTKAYANGTGIVFVFIDFTGLSGINNNLVNVCMAYKITFI